MCFHVFTFGLKNKSACKELFSYFNELGLELGLEFKPTAVSLDFEAASSFAIRFHFPGVNVKGCWFHFKQAIFNKIKEIGLQVLYNQREYKEWFNMFGVLALIPIDQIKIGFNIINSLTPNNSKCKSLISYFENTWSKGQFSNF